MKEGKNAPLGLFRAQVLLCSTTLWTFNNHEFQVFLPLLLQALENSYRAIGGTPVTDNHLEVLVVTILDTVRAKSSDYCAYLYKLAQSTSDRGVDRPPNGGDDSLLLVESRDDDGDGGAHELLAGTSSRRLELGEVLGGINVGERRVQHKAVDRRGKSTCQLG